MALQEKFQKLEEKNEKMEARLKQQEAHNAQIMKALTDAASVMRRNQEARAAGAAQYIFTCKNSVKNVTNMPK